MAFLDSADDCSLAFHFCDRIIKDLVLSPECLVETLTVVLTRIILSDVVMSSELLYVEGHHLKPKL